MRPRLSTFAVTAVFAALYACGGGDGPTQPAAAAVATVTVAPDGQSVTQSQTLPLTATLRDAANNVLSGRNIAWSVSPSNVGSISSTGVVTGLAPGALTVTATSEGKNGTALVTVLSNRPVATIALTSPTSLVIPQLPTPLTVVLKDDAGNTLSQRNVTWTAAPASVGSVSSTGVITAVTLGSLTVTATSEGKSATLVLSVVSGAMVGPIGGTLTLAEGDVEVQVPAGAVSANTTITAIPVSEPSLPAPDDWQTVGQQYAIGASVTTFAQPVTVKLKYKSGDLPPFVMSGDMAVRFANAGQWSSLSDVVIDDIGRTIAGRTTTFGAASSILVGTYDFGISSGRVSTDRATGIGVPSASAGGPSGSTIGISAKNPVVSVSPGTASVNAQQRSVTFFAALAPSGSGVRLPANTPLLQYRWTTTGRNGALSVTTQWTTTTEVQYTATNAVLNQLSGPIDNVKVEVLLNPGVTDPAKQRIVSAQATVNADLERTYEISPASPIVGPGEAKTLQLVIRDKQGTLLTLPGSQSLSWSTSGVFGSIGVPGPRQESITYQARATFNNPPPRVDDVSLKVKELRTDVVRVFRPNPLGGEGAFDETTVTRTVNVADAKTFVEVKVNYNIALNPPTKSIGIYGNTNLSVTMTPAYTGPGLMYKYTNLTQNGTLSVANGVPTTASTVSYTAPSTSGVTDRIKVDVVSIVAGVELETLGSAEAVITVTSAFPVWQFTSFVLDVDQSGANPITGNPQIGSTNHLTYELGVFTGIRDGVKQGGLLYIPRDTTFLTIPIGGTPELHKRGLYVIDGTQITSDLLSTLLAIPFELQWFNAFTNPPFIRGSWILSPPPAAARRADNALFDEGYTESGTIVGGAISGTYWRYQTTNTTQAAGTLWFPFLTRQANVTFSGNTVSGTITIVARDFDHSGGNSLPKPETKRWTVRVTFTGTRIP